MKANIHPKSIEVLAKCVCGNEFIIHAALEAKTISMEVCNKCHPFYTGKQQNVVAAGRVENFNNKFMRKVQTSQAPKVAQDTKGLKDSAKKLKAIKAPKVAPTGTKKPSKGEAKDSEA